MLPPQSPPSTSVLLTLCSKTTRPPPLLLLPQQVTKTNVHQRSKFFIFFPIFPLPLNLLLFICCKSTRLQLIVVTLDMLLKIGKSLYLFVCFLFFKAHVSVKPRKKSLKNFNATISTNTSPAAGSATTDAGTRPFSPKSFMEGRWRPAEVYAFTKGRRGCVCVRTCVRDSNDHQGSS